MKIVKMETHMLSQKVIANVTPEFARVYNIPEGHTSVGFFSADNDDIGYLAVDDASKKANIKLIHAETYYGGTTCSWSKYGGSVFVLSQNSTSFACFLNKACCAASCPIESLPALRANPSRDNILSSAIYHFFFHSGINLVAYLH